MTDYSVVTVPGIGEASNVTPIGLLSFLTNQLPSNFAVQQFNWRNQYGPVPVWNGDAYAKNVKAAEGDLMNLIAARENVILCGYSGGAAVVSRVLARLSTTNKVKGAILVANPLRAATDSAAPGFGVSGEHRPFAADLKFIDIANPQDIIPCCPPAQNFPVRQFAELTEHFSLAEPRPWGEELFRDIQQGALTGVVGVPLHDWWLAFSYMRGYLYDGQHSKWYVPKMAPAMLQMRAMLGA